ncbi:MAG: hypothetical protein M1380_00975 [Chloroflexi bacterium]|nr:hypothetical protein [Chloroflexota bacterium]
MKTVGHLDGVGGACSRSLGVGFRPVPGDHLHPGVFPQPSCQSLGIPILGEVDGAVGLQIDEQGGVGVATAQGEVIDAEDPRRKGVWEVETSDQPKQGVRADRQTGSGSQPRSLLSTGLQGDLHEQIRGVLGPTGIPGQALTKVLGEGVATATVVDPREAAHGDQQPSPAARDGKSMGWRV